MVEVFQGISEGLLSAYKALIAAVPPVVQSFILFFGISLFIVLFAFLIWKFYKSLARKNILALNLKKYNSSKHPFFTKLLAGTFFTIEYVLVAPIVIFLWFILKDSVN